MGEFLYNITKIIGFFDFGFSSFLYAIYLILSRKLPYFVEMILKPEAREKYIKIESLYSFIYAIILFSLLIFLTYMTSHRVIIYGVHYFLVICIFFYKNSLMRDLYK